MIRVSMERSAAARFLAWSACFMAFVSLSACVPRQYVAIPPEWRTAQPPVPSAGAAPPSARQKASVPGPPQEEASIIKRKPLFKETDLPRASDSPAPVVTPKNGESQIPHQVPSQAQPQVSSQPQPQTQPQAQPRPQPKEPSLPPAVQQPPQHLASMHLVDQAKTALAQGKPDAAIPLLEQAIQVDVYNGDAFLGLARAWHAKGSPKKSLEFAKKAEILFQNEPGKLKEVYRLEAELYKEIGDPTKAEVYRQKAAR
jgi:hypothetical protein